MQPGANGYRPLVVAGVAGGVGTSTWVRVLRRVTSLPVHDGGVYRADQPVRQVDIVVTSNTVAAVARLGPVLARCRRPPVLVVMHTAGGQLVGARALLRTAAPHVTARFDIEHRRAWLEMPAPPGARLPTKAADIDRAVAGLLPALQAMYTPAAAVTGPTAIRHGGPPSIGMPRPPDMGGPQRRH